MTNDQYRFKNFGVLFTGASDSCARVRFAKKVKFGKVGQSSEFLKELERKVNKDMLKSS